MTVSDSQNPYKAPVSNEPAPTAEAVGGVTPKTRELLGQAAPWLKFLTVLGYIAVGFIAVIGLLLAVAGGFLGGLIPGFGALGPILGLVYVALAVVMFFPARILGRMAKAAKKYKLQGDAADLEVAAGAVKGLAKFYGVMALVLLAVYALLLVVGVVVAVTAASGISG